MFFRIELLNKFSQGRFSESWLAATCPTLFRRNYRKNHVLRISVPKICQDIQAMWNTDSDQVKDRLSLYLASQLLYGTVCIHQQQVHFLYETTLELFCLESVVANLIRANTQRESNKNTKYPIAKNILKCQNRKDDQASTNFLMEDYGLVVCQSQELMRSLEKEVEKLLKEPDTVSVPNASITLIEEPFMAAELHEDGFLDEEQFSGSDYCDFMNFNEEVQPTKRAKLQQAPSSILEVPLEKQTKIMCYSNIDFLESSLDLINRVNRSATPLITTSSFDNFYQHIKTGSTPMHEPPDLCLDQITTQSKQHNTIMAENTVESVVEPVQPLETDIDKIMNITPPAISNRRKVAKKRIVIDSTIEITDICLYRHIQDFTSTLRARHPTEDVMSPWQKELKLDIFHMPVNKILAIPLCAEYKNRLITKQMPTDTNFFDGLLNVNPFEVTPPRQDIGKRRGKKRTHNDQIVIEPPPPQPMIPMESEINPPPMIPIDSLLPIDPEVIPLPAMETTELPSLFPADMSVLTDSMAKEQFGKHEIYRHLEILWRLKVYPIDMRTLCAELKQRKYIAMVFYSLLCLQKDQKVKLICNSNNREIYHIQPVD